MNFTLKKSDLNFKVYTVSSKPTTPGAENDIAVISSVPMTNWLMSPDKPSGIPRNDGDVWIRYSTQGDTKNILKQNAMMIATIFAWQYVDGAWVDRDAVSCQGGEWVDWWSGELYDNGNEYESITGGWSNDGASTASGDSSTLFSATKNADHIVIGTTSTSSSDRWFTIFTNKKIAITKEMRQLCAKATPIAVGNNSFSLGLYSVKITDNAITKSDFAGVAQRTETFSLDIPAIEGEYYVGMTVWIGANAKKCANIHKVWLE